MPKPRREGRPRRRRPNVRRLSVAELRTKHPYLFEDLEEWVVGELEEYFELCDNLVFYALLTDTANRSKRVDPRVIVHDEVVAFLLATLHRVSRMAKCEHVADDAKWAVELRLEDAGYGRTRGEQRAASLLRHPHAHLKPPEDARQLRGRRRDDLFTAIRIVRLFEQLRDELKGDIPRSKQARVDGQKELTSGLLKKYPELASMLGHPADVIDLTPEWAARIILGARFRPARAHSTVSGDLGRARRVIEQCRQARRRKTKA